MNYPKISVITASYNQGHYLEHTIKSIVEQGYPNLEYIIIDGGSTDNSVDIIKKYEQQISYWISEKDKGVGDAIHKGIKQSTGEIIGCINSDDMLHSKSLFTLAEIFNNFPSINWLVGASTIYDEQGRTVEVRQSKSLSLIHFLLKEMYFIQFESCFWRRSIWEKAGGYFNKEIKYAGDFDLWARFFKHDKLWISDALIGGFRARQSNQLSLDNMDVYLNEVQQIVKSLELDDATKTALRKAKQIRSLLSVLRTSRILNITFLSSRLMAQYEKVLDYPPRLRFDRKLQRFIIN